jgi:hypothetical protein
LAAELQLASHADQPDMVRILKLTTSLLQNCRSAENCARPETAPAA